MQALKVKVAKLTDLSINIGKTVVENGQEFALFLLEDGQIRAIENRCPHKSGPLSEGMVSGQYSVLFMTGRSLYAMGKCRSPIRDVSKRTPQPLKIMISTLLYKKGE